MPVLDIVMRTYVSVWVHSCGQKRTEYFRKKSVDPVKKNKKKTHYHIAVYPQHSCIRGLIKTLSPQDTDGTTLWVSI